MFKVFIGDREVADEETYLEASKYIMDYFSGDLQGIRPVGAGDNFRKFHITSDDSLFEVKIEWNENDSPA